MSYISVLKPFTAFSCFEQQDPITWTVEPENGEVQDQVPFCRTQ